MRLNYWLIYFIFALFLGVNYFFASTAFSASPANISINMLPENPAPGEKVAVKLSSYTYSLDSVNIRWSLDGQIISSGIGRTSVVVSAPGEGEESRLTANISLPDGDVDKIMFIRPSVMVLLWQADDSYVPPFYKGKAFPSAESRVKIVALPEVRNGTSMVNPKNMVYAWQKDYTNDPNASGYGKNSYSFVSDYLEDITSISVTASTTDQSYFSSGNMNIRTYEPKIIFYKKDGALGTLWEKALMDGHKIEGDEIIEADPYFISPDDIRIPSLSWDWSINGSRATANGVNKNLLPVTIQPGATGVSKIQLEVSNMYKLLGGAKKELDVEF